MNGYAAFIAQKFAQKETAGIRTSKLAGHLYPYQRALVKWALEKGRAALFCDTGLGKTAMQIEWADRVHRETRKPVLILAPLAVAGQTVREGRRFGYNIEHSRDGAHSQAIVVTNYEQLEKFVVPEFGGVVLDESSILKAFTGRFRNMIISAFHATQYRLACTATPAPNDFMEIGNHAEFCGILRMSEMLARFFVHDGGSTQNWRLKGHCEELFWDWCATWSAVVMKPSDLGGSDEGFVLPPLVQEKITVGTLEQGEVLPKSMTLTERRNARRASLAERVAAAAAQVNTNSDTWLVWCDLNAESAALAAAIPGAVEVKGSDGAEFKEATFEAFSAGEIRVLITKPSIAGFGMNWQHCARMAFVGLSDSFEQLYQATRRCWRFGQTREVHVKIITAIREGAIVDNIQRKSDDFARFQAAMINATQKQVQL